MAGALYLDLGFAAVRDWLIALAEPELSAEAPIGSLKSPKSRLQEYTQRRSGDRPTYRLLDATGPDHEKSFRIEVWVDGTLLGVGEGPSRRTAETAAASQAMERLRAQAGRRSLAADRTVTAVPTEPNGLAAPTTASTGRGRRAEPRLLALRVHGFKSFAERTNVEFGPGISAVVGPNGSGKSNLADALRWALGEQGRALRSRKAEDVIWAGSEKRPAQGMADVSLVIDNADGLLPVDYQVLELGRRLYRSGENDYLLNKTRIRLRELVDLLDAAHLADNAFLFIGQGMVDQALALRPEERRPLFDEVAGVRRHERRRRRAEEQLVESEANLARVEDILGELRPQARRLAAQAEQQATRLIDGRRARRGAARGHARPLVRGCGAARGDRQPSASAPGRGGPGHGRAGRRRGRVGCAGARAVRTRGRRARAPRSSSRRPRRRVNAARLREARLASEVGRDRARPRSGWPTSERRPRPSWTRRAEPWPHRSRRARSSSRRPSAEAERDLSARARGAGRAAGCRAGTGPGAGGGPPGRRGAAGRDRDRAPPAAGGRTPPGRGARAGRRRRGAVAPSSRRRSATPVPRSTRPRPGRAGVA